MTANQKNKKATVYNNLKKRIISNALMAGDPLNEGLLSKELKTSKTPVREALQQLEKEGFVENIPGKGAFVSRFSFQDIRELFEIREILEVEIIKKVVIKDNFNVSEAKSIRNKYEASGKNENVTPRTYFNAGDRIHTFIIESFGNKRLIEYYSRLQEHIIRMRLYFFSQIDHERSEHSYKEHLEIINAMIAQDPQRAEKAMREHLRNSLEFLKTRI